MRAFDVVLNERRLCRAGIGEDGVISAIVSWVAGPNGNECFFTVGGLISEKREHLDWVKHEPLKVGDRIEITVADSGILDEPTTRKADAPGPELEHRKDYIRRMAKEVGWTIQENPVRSGETNTK